MLDIKEYGLSKIPFATAPKIQINSKDKRINGRLFYDNHAKKELINMCEMIQSQHYSINYLRAHTQTYGNGKSAFLANIYWKLYDEDENVLWITATENPKLTVLLSNMLDAIISQDIIKKLKSNLKNINYKNLKKLLSGADTIYRPNTIRALVKIIGSDESDIAHRYSNIKRSMPTQNFPELFGAILDTCYQNGEKRFTIFIDQFEEYVTSHSGERQIQKLNAELNDLIRAIGDMTTLVVSTHPEAESTLTSSNMELDTFSDIVASSVDLPEMKESDMLKMILLYLNEFRTRKKLKSEFYPFTRSVIKYSAHRTGFNPRDLINALRYSLSIAMRRNSKRINYKFISKYHKNIFGGLDNRIEEFREKEWKYEKVTI